MPDPQTSAAFAHPLCERRTGRAALSQASAARTPPGRLRLRRRLRIRGAGGPPGSGVHLPRRHGAQPRAPAAGRDGTASATRRFRPLLSHRPPCASTPPSRRRDGADRRRRPAPARARRPGAVAVPGGAGAGRRAAAANCWPWRACSWPGRWPRPRSCRRPHGIRAARFVEAAAALTVAYLAVEILLLPAGGSALAGGRRPGRASTASISPCSCAHRSTARPGCWRARRWPRSPCLPRWLSLFARVGRRRPAAPGTGVRFRPSGRRDDLVLPCGWRVSAGGTLAEQSVELEQEGSGRSHMVSKTSSSWWSDSSATEARVGVE